VEPWHFGALDPYLPAYRASASVSSSARAVPCHESVESNVSSREWVPVDEPPPSMVTAGMPRLIGMFESVDP
jgi:hypothetical protein